jgi:hypothetical protein
MMNFPDAVGFHSQQVERECTGMVAEEISARVTSVLPHETPGCVGERFFGATQCQGCQTNAGLSVADSPQACGGGVTAGETAPATDSPATDAPATYRRLTIGARRLAAARRVLELRAAGAKWAAVAAEAGLTITMAWRLWREASSMTPDQMTADAFAPATPGPRRKALFTPDERKALRGDILVSNRDWRSGSAPEATRRAIKRGLVRRDMADRLLEREADGKPLLTPAMRRELHVGEGAVRAFRNPRDAWLDYVQSPGSLQLCVDDESGYERPVEPGEAWTIDDGTINLICNVPTMDPRWKHEVMPGRFQFLLVVDHRSYYIPGFCYTARPKGSYRAEDLLATLHIAMREHGAPKRLILEHGISAADSITRCCELSGIEIDRAESPHEKMVEMVFGCLWTKLSFLPGQVGRYQGEEAGVTAVLESCRRGAKDPRQHFPMLAEVLAAMREAIADWNDHWVNSKRYGHWRPSEFWSEKAGRHLRPIAQADSWMFAPRVTDPLKVRGLMLATSVQMAPGFSQQFTFNGDWLVDWIGARVRLHFNPFDGESRAKAVLAEPFAGQRDGLVLGDLEMVDRQARYTRRAWGYSDEMDDGGAAARRAAQGLHRAVQATRPDGKMGVTSVEVRDGLVESMEQGAWSGEHGAESVVGVRQRSTFNVQRSTLNSRRMDPRLAEFYEVDEADLESVGSADTGGTR